MNKKIIFAAVGAVSLIGGIAAGFIHRSNKRYRRALSEFENAADVFDDAEDDDECSGCEADEKCCECAEKILKELEEGTYRE